jgi:ankyrin repeat protein
MVAASIGHFQILQLLITRGVDVDRRNHFGQTALHTVATNHEALNNDSRVVGLIFQHTGDVSISDHTGYTPLHCACRAGLNQVIERLLQHHTKPLLEAADFLKICIGWSDRQQIPTSLSSMC